MMVRIQLAQPTVSHCYYSNILDGACKSLERTRQIIRAHHANVVSSIHGRAATSTAAEGIAAVVGTAVDRALGHVTPYGSRGDELEAQCDISIVTLAARSHRRASDSILSAASADEQNNEIRAE